MPKRFAVVAAIALLIAGALFVQAQPEPARAKANVQPDPGKLREQIISLATELELLRLEYEFKRDICLAGYKMAVALDTVGSVFSGSNSSDDDLPQDNPADDQAQAVKLEEQQQAKRHEEELERMLTDGKKRVAMLYAPLVAKRLELEDAERRYHEIAR